MESQYEVDEEHLQEVLHIYHERKERDGKVNVAALAREFKVNEPALRRRTKGIGSKSTRTPTNLVLTEAQYEALYEYIDRLEEIGTPATPLMICNAANRILQRHHTDPKTSPK